jgi:hypothetical protein
MCGRYRRRLDKQRIAELLAASSDLENSILGPRMTLRLAPCSQSFEWTAEVAEDLGHEVGL